ncbi:TPA: ATP synthase F1 subunit gamma [Candidatus Saccharibacteria bacterium]|nr:ATP synthase F1 subunit gamma [Candidatus Saccharibacteria bacterium]HIO87278.1 ATP synthase F1 subunit gamma [Candidatus Saccharibacteria bacterium]
MANTQAIKRRITSVKSTKQITKAMELVAASKLRRAQEASNKSRAYKNSAREILARLSELTDAKQFELYEERPVRARLYIIFTSDRGLAGAYNANILKMFFKELKANQENGVATKAIVIGKKGTQVIARLKDEVELVGVYQDWPTYPATADLKPIFGKCVELFTSKASQNKEKREKSEEDNSLGSELSTPSSSRVDEVRVIFTDYISSINQEAKSLQLLPANLTDEIEGVLVGRDINDSEFEPSPQKVLETIVPRLTEIQLYQFALEASASEQSMRMLAMKNASDNAGDLIDDLQLEFNSARQAAITQEIAEITGGVAAVS